MSCYVLCQSPLRFCMLHRKAKEKTEKPHDNPHRNPSNHLCIGRFDFSAKKKNKGKTGTRTINYVINFWSPLRWPAINCRRARTGKLTCRKRDNSVQFNLRGNSHLHTYMQQFSSNPCENSNHVPTPPPRMPST